MLISTRVNVRVGTRQSGRQRALKIWPKISTCQKVSRCIISMWPRSLIPSEKLVFESIFFFRTDFRALATCHRGDCPCRARQSHHCWRQGFWLGHMVCHHESAHWHVHFWKADHALELPEGTFFGLVLSNYNKVWRKSNYLKMFSQRKSGEFWSHFRYKVNILDKCEVNAFRTGESIIQRISCFNVCISVPNWRGFIGSLNNHRLIPIEYLVSFRRIKTDLPVNINLLSVFWCKKILSITEGQFRWVRTDR